MPKLRQATPSDKNPVLEFCKLTFSWGDYISDVWDYWILEGNLLVMAVDDVPVAICHASITKGSQVWIEGIRVNPNFRKRGLATQLVQESEKMAQKNSCTVSKMLIHSDNTESLSLAKKLNYKQEGKKWIFYSAVPKKTDSQITDVKFANFEKKKPEILFSPPPSLKGHLYYVKSWRWRPLDNAVIAKLIDQKRIVFSEHQGHVDGLGIFTESEHFESTLMLTLLKGRDKGIEKIMPYVQNYASKTGYKRIQILATNESLGTNQDLEKRFGFYLMNKELFPT